MSNTSVKIALVSLLVLALPIASFALGGTVRGGGAAAMGQLGGIRPNPGVIGAAQSQVTDPSGIGNANRIARIPPPSTNVPTVPQFK
jgi:hypothetical protein